MNNKLQSFAKSLVVEMALRAAREFLVKQLEDTTAEDVYNAIKENKDLWERLPNSIRNGGVKIAKRFRGPFKKFYDSITVDVILMWLKTDRPDLYSIIINTEGGVKWLGSQLEEIKEGLIREI